MKALRKYLDNHAEIEAHDFSDFPKKEYEHCTVIPAYNESHDFIDRYFAHPLKGRLLILVINEPEDQKQPPAPRHTSKQLVNFIHHHSQYIWQEKNVSLYEHDSCDILIVNRYAPHLRIPSKQGVGLARKIGCDIAVRLFDKQQLTTPIIFSSDADALLPHNYFQKNLLPLTDKRNGENISAWVFNFSHTAPVSAVNTVNHAALFDATLAYEKALKYLRAGLRWSDSPYAFYTLGSTLALSIPHYCMARGFPKRAGAEDFYLLNKLAKVGAIYSDDRITIAIESRLSQRIPFGTGPAVEKILQSQETYTYFHPNIFDALKTWLIWALNAHCGTTKNPIHDNKNINRKLLSQAQTVAQQLHYDKFLSHAKKTCKSAIQFEKAFHQWFDGFMTVKFIRKMEKDYWPPVPLPYCINAAKQWETNKDERLS